LLKSFTVIIVAPTCFCLHKPSSESSQADDGLCKQKHVGATTRVNQKVKAIFKLRGNRDREELKHCAVLTMPVEEFSHVQYSALPSVEWQ